jgi:hypothetical protein
MKCQVYPLKDLAVAGLVALDKDRLAVAAKN